MVFALPKGRFKSGFFTGAGQVERVKNIGKVFGIAFNPFSKDRIVAGTGRSKVERAVGKAANINPFISAGIAAAPFVGAVRKAAAATAVKAGKAFAGAGFGTQAKIVGGGIIGAGVLSTSQRARKAATSAVTEGPKSLATFGANIGRAIDDPSAKNIKQIFKDDPLIATAAAGLGVAGVAKATSAAAPIIGGVLASKQRKDIVEAVRASPKALPPAAAASALPAVGPVVSQDQNPLQNAAAGEEPAPEPVKQAKSPTIKQKTEVNIGNFIKNKYKRVKYGKSNRKYRKSTKRK